MIEVCKIMHGVENVDRETFFSLSQNTRTRSHPMKLFGGRSRTNRRKYLFTQHIVKLWNSLPQDVVMATNLDGFKGGWINSWRRRQSTSTSPDGYVLPPVSEAVSSCTPVAGEHGWQGAVALVSCWWNQGQQLIGHCVNRIMD